MMTFNYMQPLLDKEGNLHRMHSLLTIHGEQWVDTTEGRRLRADELTETEEPIITEQDAN